MKKLLFGMLVLVLFISISRTWAEEKSPTGAGEIKKMEVALIDSIKVKGTGDRFVIAEIRPAKKNNELKIPHGVTTVIKYKTGIVAVIGGFYEEDDPWVYPFDGGPGRMSSFPMNPSEAYYPSRSLGLGGFFAVREDGTLTADGKNYIYDGVGRIIEENEKIEDFVPMMDGGICRFIGKHMFQGFEFYGEESDPLTFVLIENRGYVYLHGKGTVSLKDGKKARFGY